MSIETNCQNCGKRLRVAEEHAGKLARCPGCQTVYTVPTATFAGQPAASTTSPASPYARPAASGSPFAPLSDANGRWHLKTPDGLTYGPVPRRELDQWQREGRITAQSQVMSEAEGRWTWAGQVYPQLQARSLAADAPAKPDFSDSFNPYAPPGYAPAAYGPVTWLEPHHGAVVLTLGILGLLFCGVLSWVAVILGIIDLQKMAKGTMDPGGRGLTIAGLVLGGLSVALQAFFLLAVVVGSLQ
jgi:hypothetical protein